MKKAINFLHNENSILTSYDNVFFRKEDSIWKEVKDKNVFKGISNPLNNSGNNGDYYIQYEEVGNYIANSEDFTSSSWKNYNNILSVDTAQYFPKSYATKMIPNSVTAEHFISTSWNTNLEDTYWCFSMFVMPSELKCFQLILSDQTNSYGAVAQFSITLNASKKYVIEKEGHAFPANHGDEIEFDDTCYDIVSVSSGIYQVYIAGKFKYNTSLKATFKLLKNINGVYETTFSNNGTTNGLFINGAQITKAKEPSPKYISSKGGKNIFAQYYRLWLKSNNVWNELEDYNNIWYGSDTPKDILGENGDLYFIHPIIELGRFPRFGKNTLYKCWENNSAEYFTEFDEPSVNDKVYIHIINDVEEVGHVLSYTKSTTDDPSTIVVKINNDDLTLYKNSEKDFRILYDEGLMFWNSDKGTYSYISENQEVKNIAFKRFYDPEKFVDAISFSTNLFNQTYSSRYEQNKYSTKNYPGFNTGGHGNFWDYNRLRRFY